MKKVIIAIVILGFSLTNYAQEVTVKEKIKSKVQRPVVEKKVVKEESAQPVVSGQNVTTSTSHNAYRTNYSTPRRSVRHYHAYHRNYHRHLNNRRHYSSTSHHYAKAHKHYTKSHHIAYKEVKHKSSNKKYKVKYKY
ncbi:MAG: hypothetical protein ACJ748_12565 [Flavisolibacter sp.]